MKPHYTDPLKAAYMAREFSVTFTAMGGQEHLPKDMRHGVYLKWGKNFGYGLEAWKNRKLYIHDESLSIFEPQVGDIIILQDEACKIVADGIASWGGQESVCDSGAKIILRDGKPFFWPGCEE